MISLGRCPWSRPTSTEFSNRTISRRRGLLSRPLEDEAQVKAEVQEKESRSVQQSMAKWNLGVSRATSLTLPRLAVQSRVVVVRERKSKVLRQCTIAVIACTHRSVSFV